MATIHPTAVVSKEAQLGENVEIGPGAIIDGPVRLGNGVRIVAQAYICGHTEIGDECIIHPFAAIGGVPQDYAHKGERSYVKVGPRTRIHEGVTIHRGTAPESTTSVGADCMLMAFSHVAHNVTVANRVVIVNGALLGGYVTVGEKAFIGGNVAGHQFVRFGEYSMIGGMARCTLDVPPFLMAIERNTVVGLNRVGLRRANFPREDIDELRELFRALYRSNRPIRSVARERQGSAQTPSGNRLLEFILEESKRGVIGQPHGRSFVARGSVED